MHLRGPGRVDRAHGRGRRALRGDSSRARDRRDRLHGARLLLRADPRRSGRCRTTSSAALRHRAVRRGRRRGEAPRLPVKLGLEVDYDAGREEETAEAARAVPVGLPAGLDPLPRRARGSTRAEPGRRVGVEEAWHRYYEALAAAAQRALRLARAPRPRQDPFGDEIDWDWERSGLARRRRARGLERGPAQAARQALSRPGAARGLRASGRADHARIGCACAAERRPRPRPGDRARAGGRLRDRDALRPARARQEPLG